MPKAPQLESGRAGTHLKVCRTLPPGSVPLPLRQPCLALDRCCFSQSLVPQPTLMEAWLDIHRSQGCEPRVLFRSLAWREPDLNGRFWGLRPSRFPWALSREGEVPLEAERGRVWG